MCSDRVSKPEVSGDPHYEILSCEFLLLLPVLESSLTKHAPAFEHQRGTDTGTASEAITHLWGAGIIEHKSLPVGSE